MNEMITERKSRIATNDEVQKILAFKVQELKKNSSNDGPEGHEVEWDEYLVIQRKKVEAGDVEDSCDIPIPGRNLIINDDDEINYYLFVKKELLSAVKVDIKNYNNQSCSIYILSFLENNSDKNKEYAVNIEMFLENNGKISEADYGNYIKIFK